MKGLRSKDKKREKRRGYTGLGLSGCERLVGFDVISLRRERERDNMKKGGVLRGRKSKGSKMGK